MQEFGMIILVALIVALVFVGQYVGYEKGYKDGLKRGYDEGITDTKNDYNRAIAKMRVRGDIDAQSPFEACKLYEPEKKRA